MNKVLRTILLLVFAATFLISGYFLLDYFLESRKQAEKYDDLAQMVEDARTAAGSSAPDRSGLTSSAIDSGSITGDISLVTVKDPETGEDVTIMADYAQLYEINNDLVGWIQIPDTVINYPVMQAPDSKDYYLHLNFYEEYSSQGCIYAREECDFQTPSDNVTIYGHNMKDGSMFAALASYESYDYWEDHQFIFLDTLDQRHVYQIISVFKTTASIGQGFDYHLFVNAEDEADYSEFIGTCQKLALYDTGLTAEYGEKLITLSTCEYSQTNGRLVVVAKRITE